MGKKKKKISTPPENTQRNIDIYTNVQAQKATNGFWKSMNNFNDYIGKLKLLP